MRPWVHSALHHSALGTPSTPAPPLPCSKRGHTLSLFNSNNKMATSSKVRHGLRGTSFLHFKDFQRRQPVVSPYSSLSLAVWKCPPTANLLVSCFRSDSAGLLFPFKVMETFQSVKGKCVISWQKMEKKIGRRSHYPLELRGPGDFWGPPPPPPRCALRKAKLPHQMCSDRV